MKHNKLITCTPAVAQADETEKWQFRVDMIEMIAQWAFNKYGHGTI